MKHPLVWAVAGLVLLGAGVASEAGQATKSARGAVSAVGPDSVSVSVNGQEMKFSVDGKTEVVATGGGTQMRSAQAEGKGGPPLGSLVKAGQTVEVRYHEAGMHAASIRVLPAGTAAAGGTAAGAGAPSQKPAGAGATSEKPASTLSGTVTAVTGASLTVKGSTGESRFVVDPKTTVIGRGLSTQARASAATGKTQTIGDMVGVGDAVTVTFHETGGAKHAAEVRITTKAPK